MKEILKMTLKLFVITFIAGALLGGTYFITKDPIAEPGDQAGHRGPAAGFAGGGKL